MWGGPDLKLTQRGTTPAPLPEPVGAPLVFVPTGMGGVGAGALTPVVRVVVLEVMGRVVEFGSPLLEVVVRVVAVDPPGMTVPGGMLGRTTVVVLLGAMTVALGVTVVVVVAGTVVALRTVVVWPSRSLCRPWRANSSSLRMPSRLASNLRNISAWLAAWAAEGPLLFTWGLGVSPPVTPPTRDVPAPPPADWATAVMAKPNRAAIRVMEVFMME